MKTELFLRAFDKTSGERVWEHKMDEAPFGTPMSYLYEGKQYIVVAVGDAGDPALGAYALPDER